MSIIPLTSSMSFWSIIYSKYANVISESSMYGINADPKILYSSYIVLIVMPQSIASILSLNNGVSCATKNSA